MLEKVGFEGLVSNALKELIEIEEREQAYLLQDKKRVDKYLQYIMEDLALLEKRSNISNKLSESIKRIWDTKKTRYFHLGEWIKNLLFNEEKEQIEQIASCSDIPVEALNQIIKGQVRTIELITPKILAMIMDLFGIDLQKLRLILMSEDRVFSGIFPSERGLFQEPLLTDFDRDGFVYSSHGIRGYLKDLRKNLLEIGRGDLLD